MKIRLPLFSFLSLALVLASCRRSGESGEAGGPAQRAGKFVIAGTRTDNADMTQARANAENALQLHTDLTAMVGLYGYNPPACLEALKEADRNGNHVLGKVRIFGFDGLESTLAGIKDGHIDGTVVQQPFEFGYQSMKTLKAISDGRPVAAKDGIIDIPVKVITKDTAAAYEAEVKQLVASAHSGAAAPPGAPRFAFISNNQSSFWEEARAGCLKAQTEFGLAVDFQMPGAQEASEQNRIIETILQKADCKGMAISVISPDSQGPLLQQVADKMPLVTHDSDAPQSARKYYLGTNNYEAGRALARLMKQRLPDGGKVMVFVGSVDAQNARDRQRGLMEELAAP